MFAKVSEEEKNLLTLDFCSRLPYRIFYDMSIVSDETPRLVDEIAILCTENVRFLGLAGWYAIEDAKPYLRSLTKMTEEEQSELFQLMGNGTDVERIDFYLSHYFDYRSLILKGLAIEAPEDMYNKKKIDYDVLV